MKIAVVGGNGFIGREFVTYASCKGHVTVVIGSDYDVFSAEGEKAAKEILRSCDAMIFLAAKRSTDSFAMPEYLYNVQLAEKYFSLAREENLGDIVFTSSFSVYSGNPVNWKEDDYRAPLSLYGASKQAIDSVSMLYNEKYGMKIKCLRLAQVVGMGERKGYLLNTLIDNAIAGRKQTIYGKGTGKRQYIYVKDVCDAMLHSIVEMKDTAGVFNIGMSYHVSIIELARVINEVFGNTAGIEMLEDKPEDTCEYFMDISKATNDLHWQANYDLRSAFEDIRDHRV